MKNDKDLIEFVDNFLKGQLLFDIKEVLSKYSALPPKLDDSLVYQMWEELKAIPSKQELAGAYADIHTREAG